mmetsp:Transcript_28922/g.72666  ORF Transcript_28922/g.72666 Transcript_28922/m.72666 type:complete len:498 (+) Transcript_28922:3549-5042(+)
MTASKNSSLESSAPVPANSTQNLKRKLKSEPTLDNHAPSSPRDTKPTKKYMPDLSVLDDANQEDYYIEPICPIPKAKKPKQPPQGAWTLDTKDILGPDSQHAYVQRWMKLCQQEATLDTKYVIVQNDGSRENLLRLLGLKNVFVKQLPNMPRPYVTRLVFDRKHESVALLKKATPPAEGEGGTDTKDEKKPIAGEDKGDLSYIVMGGCCYRPFPAQGFGEIAFMAISQNEQVRGYGTRLMAQTKERAKALGLKYLLTCADNNAVAYFKKQGFSKRITLEYEKWQGYIKDYDGVTLMECKLHENVDYLNIPAMLKAQKMCLVEKLKEISYSHIVFPGIDVKKRKGMQIADIPGFKHLFSRKLAMNAGTSGGALTGLGAPGTRGNSAMFAQRDPAALQALHKHLQSVLNQVKAHQNSWPFVEPVDPKESGALDYYDVIKNPMDLQTIQKRLDSGWYYVTKQIFLADLKRMTDNCLQYNGKGHYITELAQSLEKFFMQKL